MGWFAEKKFPAIDDLPADDDWSVATGENDGNPLFLRINTSAKQFMAHPDLPIRLGIAVPLHDPNEHGLPSEKETQELHDIEERLFEALGTSGRVVLIITTGGMREFVSYVRSTRTAEQAAASLRAATDTHEVQHYAAADAKWELFGEFA